MNPMNGLLLVDKPPGMTSHDVVHKVRRALGIRGIGHAGTLDPLASGLLVLLIGEGTKVSDYLLNGDKGYEFRVKLGEKTDSMDVTGEVIASRPVDVTEEQIRSMALSLQGEIELEVPVHSAVKVDGQRLYKLAHKGERPDSLPIREMRFYDLEVAEISSDSVLIRMKCSKGGFVRAWANHFGEKLGCGGTVQTLRRVYSAPFAVSDAITLEKIELVWSEKEKRHGEVFGAAWIPLKDALPHFERIDVAGHDETLLRNGQISKGLQTQLLQFVRHGEDAMPPVRVVSRETDDLAAILLSEPGHFYKIKRVFHRV
jgi:tRNA pseudouridine55 synthase